MPLIQNGNTRAFDEIYTRYSSKMLRYFHKMLNKDENKAQDFLQDLFVKIIEKAHLYDPKKRFSTWLYTLAANMCKNEYRRNAVRGSQVQLDGTPDLTAETYDCLKALDMQSFNIQLPNAINQLTEKHKTVFLLRYQQELSIKEIALILDCSEGTVKSRIFYALKKLAIRLQAFNPIQ